MPGGAEPGLIFFPRILGRYPVGTHQVLLEENKLHKTFRKIERLHLILKNRCVREHFIFQNAPGFFLSVSMGTHTLKIWVEVYTLYGLYMGIHHSSVFLHELGHVWHSWGTAAGDCYTCRCYDDVNK
jgi:hypothetical protein